MTAMAEKMKAAGVNTGAAKLYTVACDLLRKAKTPEKALHPLWQKLTADREMRETLMLDYLRRVAADMAAGAAAGKSHGPRETQAAGAPPAAGSIRVKAHDVRAHRRRTQKEKDAAIAATMMVVDEIYERKINDTSIGDIRWEQLPGLVREMADRAARNLLYGTVDTANGILLKKCVAYANVDDGRTPVREVIPAEVLARFHVEARAEAPLLIEAGMREHAARIIAAQGIEHAA